jgi:ribosomal protein S18 acetylase RimI-like enzyme
MMRFVTQRARKLGCDRVMLRVNRNNYQAILAYEHLGFVRIGELCSDIGNGYVMDDFVYQFDL